MFLLDGLALPLSSAMQIPGKKGPLEGEQLDSNNDISENSSIAPFVLTMAMPEQEDFLPKSFCALTEEIFNEKAPFFLAMKPVAIPENYALCDLVFATPEMQCSNAVKAEVIEIDEALVNNRFFAVKRLFRDTVISEYYTHQFDYLLRCAFAKAFQALYEHYHPQAEKILKGDEPYGNYHLKLREELYWFAKEGRGGETVRIFCKVLLPLSITDTDYRSKIKSFASRQWQFSPDDIVPDTNRCLKDLAQATYKNIPIKGEFFLTQRLELQEKEFLLGVAQVSALNALLREHFVGLAKMSLFIRGSIQSHKMALLFTQFKLKPSQMFNWHELAKNLGGDLARDEAEEIACKVCKEEITYELNVHADNLSMSKHGGTQVVWDICIEGSEEEEAIRQARPALIKAACADDQIQWHLWEYRGESFIKAAQIVNRRFQVVSQARLTYLRQKDPLLDNALHEFSVSEDKLTRIS